MIIPISFDLDVAALSQINSPPRTWPALQTDADGLLSIEAVKLELEGFDASTNSLMLFADPGRQTSLSGSARTIWAFRPGAAPSWLIPGPTLPGGLTAECRLPVVMRARTLRLWTDQRSQPLSVSGSVFLGGSC